jgi:CelD/BcsL family acetyltransferase involved in cellulose biosynthesis
MGASTFDSVNGELFLDPSDERWLTFAASRPQVSVFHHPAWMSVLAECYGYHPFVVAVGDTTGRITAGLPMMEVNSRVTGRRWVSLPFTDYCPPLYEDEASLDKLNQSLLSLYEDGSAPKIEIRWELPAHEGIQSYSDYVLHAVKLDTNAEEVAKSFNRTHRQNIGTAEKRGVHIEWGERPEHIHLFYRLQLTTRRRKGLPVQPRKFFDLLGSKIIEQGLGFVLLACKDDECLAGGLFLHWGQTLTYKYAASSDHDQKLRPNNLLTWTAIRWGCENHYTVFDLGRADLPNSGLRRFKRGWGADEMPLTYSTLGTTIPQPKTGKMMSVMETVIQKSPEWVCQAAGEVLYRHVG